MTNSSGGREHTMICFIIKHCMNATDKITVELIHFFFSSFFLLFSFLFLLTIHIKLETLTIFEWLCLYLESDEIHLQFRFGLFSLLNITMITVSNTYKKTHDPRILKTWTATKQFLFLFWSKEVIKWRQIFWLPDFFGDVTLVISLGA